MDAGDEKRLWRVFRASRPVPRAEQVWRGDSALLGVPNVALLVGLAAVPVLGYLDSVLWSNATRIGRASSPSGTFVAWVLIAGCLVQMGLVERFLARQTREEIRVRAWLRGVRPLVAAVPLFGLYAVPGWLWLLDRHPAWAFRAAQPGRASHAWLLRFEGTSRWLASLRVLYRCICSR